MLIEQLLVSPRHEHEGIGNQLVDYAEGFAISEGAARLQIVVEPDNRRALDFYARRSFSAPRRRPRAAQPRALLRTPGRLSWP